MLKGRSFRFAVRIKNWSPTHSEWIRAAQSVQAEEKERIGKFYFKRDAKSAMVGRLLLRYAVAKILNIPSRSLLFSRTEEGKPVLLSPVDRTTIRTDISFSVSHSGDFVVLAAEKGRSVGVDAMQVQWLRNTSVKDFFKTMVRQYTEDEWSFVKQREKEMDQLKIFYRIWSLKESIVKAFGTGIGFGLDRLNFNLKTPDVAEGSVVIDTQVEIDGELAPEWSFEETFLENHCVAVAVSDLPSGPPPLEQGDIPPESRHFQVLDIGEVLAGCDPLVGNLPDQEYWENFNSKEEEPKLR